jgi:hypothetical protein
MKTRPRGTIKSMQYVHIFVSLFGKENEIIRKVLSSKYDRYNIVVMYTAIIVLKSPIGYPIYYKLYSKAQPGLGYIST